MMKKRMTALVLAIVLLAGLYPVTARAEGLSEAWLRVNFVGAVTRQRVMQDDDGQIFVPVDWLEYFGACKKSVSGDTMTFTPVDQQEEKNFARRIFVTESTGEFAICFYAEKDLAKKIGKKKAPSKYDDSYYPLYQGKFSTTHRIDDILWAPIEEVLPIMNLEAAVSQDGDLCLSNVPMTVFEALYLHADEMEDQLFDADDIWGKDAMVVTGWVVSTCMDLRIDRAFYNWGKSNDYEYLFEDYLTDSEAYLSLFGGGSDPVTDDIRQVAQGGDIMKSIYSVWGDAYDATGVLEYLNTTGGVGTSKVLEGVVDIPSKGVDAVVSLCKYLDIYSSQVEDHRLMLDAVYHYNKKETKNWPSRSAADTISGLYDTDAVDSMKVFEETAWELLLSMSQNEFKDAFMSKLGPWFIAIELTKVFAADACKYVNDSALIDLVDNTVTYSWKIYESRLYDCEYGAEDLTDLRLCAIMALIASRHAYKTYWADVRQDDVDAVDAILKDLYLAGIWRDYGAADSWKTWNEKYEASFDRLRCVRTVPDALAKVEYAMLLAAMEDMDLAYRNWTLQDADGDGSEELLISVMDSGGYSRESQLLADGDTMILDSHTALGASQYSEYVQAEGQSGWVISHGGASAMNGGQHYYRWDGEEWLLYTGISWEVEEKQDGDLIRHETVYTDGEVTAEGSFPIDSPESLDFADPMWTYPVYGDPDLSDFVAVGDPQTLLAALETHMKNRLGIFLADKADLDGDGDEERLYALYQPADSWLDYAQGILSGSETWLNFEDEALTIVAAEQVEDGLRLRTVRLDISHLTMEDLAKPKDCYTLMEGSLGIGGVIYYYQPEGKLFVSQAEQQSGELPYQGTPDDPGYTGDLTIEAVLAGAMEIMIDSYPDPGNMSYGVTSVGGEELEIYYGTGGIVALRVLHNEGGSLPITDGVTTDTTVNRLSAELPGASSWDGPYEVYGFGTEPEWYEHYCEWYNGLDGSLWYVTVMTRTGDADELAGYITFSRADGVG